VFNDEDEDDDDDDEEEREEERQKAAAAFDAVDKDSEGSIPATSLELIFKAMRTVYCEEEHSHTAKKLSREGRIHKNDFVRWYEEWIFDDGDSEGSDAEDDVVDTTMKSPEEIKAKLAQFQPKEGSWQCTVCMVRNSDPALQRCASCESPNPNAPKVAAPAALKPATGAGGFTFGITPAAAST
ncbi:nuclear pore complex protein, partial [Achlya hypogyna]